MALSEVERIYPKSDIILNTEIFNMKTEIIEGQIVIKSKNVGNSYYTYGVGFNDTNLPLADLDNNEHYDEYLGRYSGLVENSIIKTNFDDKSKRERTALGITNDVFSILCISDD